MIKPELLYLHICDDVRKEINGKISLMGIYDSIVSPEIPCIIPKLYFYCGFDNFYNDHIFDFILKSPSGEELKLIQNARCENNGIFSIEASPFEINEAGDYEIIINITDVRGENRSANYMLYTYKRIFKVMDELQTH